MVDLATWISILTGIALLAVTYVAYRSQRGKSRLEFVVLVNTRVAIFEPALATVTVAYNDKEVPDASVVVMRLVNTGDKAILADHFSSDIVVYLDGINEVAAATVTRTRPGGLNPQLTIDGSKALIAPLLINAGDMIELQLLTSGRASSIRMEGRIANVSAISKRKDLPYPPGSGSEGEMLGFDKFMWYVFAPGSLGGLAIVSVVLAHVSTPIKVVASLVVAILVFIIYPLQVRYLVVRRRLWRP